MSCYRSPRCDRSVVADLLRVGVAGLGFGRAVHLPVLRAIDGVELCAVASTDADRASTVAEEFGVPLAVGSIAELLDIDLDAVVLSLPPGPNELAVAAAADRDLAILSEKSLALSASESEALTRRAEGLTAAVDFEFPDTATFRALSDVVRSGQLGDLRRLDVSWLTLSRAQEAGVWSWKTDRRQGGGVLNLLGSHVVHLLERLVGPITQVAASADHSATLRFAPTGSDPAFDSVSVVGSTASGVLISIRLDNACRGSQVHEWRLVGTEGSAIARNDSLDPVSGFELRTIVRGEETLVDRDDQGVDGRAAAVREVVARFVAAARASQQASPTFADAARAQVVVEAIERAATSGSSVRLPQV